MPPLPGEERLLTVFVDVHYYFSPPSPRTLHHRFDKGSYFYIYHDAAQNKARIEIANNPGTAEQDAFYGSLSTISLRNSDKFPTLFTVTVDARRHGSTPPPSADQNEWRLANIDPRDGSQALLRLHTLDLYFWTSNDAAQFLNAAQKILASTQLEIIGSPQQPYDAGMSSVVQQLENVAITDPAYHNGQTRNSRTNPPPLQHPAPQQAVPSFAPPPTQTAAPSEPVSPLEEQAAPPASKPQEQQVNYAPLAYNPSAPAAPEPIKHREKTPPPPDAATGTGLAAAAVSDQGQAFAPPPPPMAGGFAPPPPGQAPGYGGQYGSPPPSAGLNHNPSISSHSSGHNPSGSLSFGPPPTTSQAPTTAPYAQSPQDPNAHLFRQQSFGPPPVSGPHNPAPQQYQGNYQEYQHGGQAPPPPQPPIGGYSNYSYGHPQQQQQQQQHQAPGGNVYDVHNQVYRPTEAEGMKQYHKQQLQQKQSGIEKGVGRLFKKLEKKL
ncbi:hypothetical protein FQN53_006025 [Emmonsiellopsis sp. PD_33]|nr:hypothetical protein FQN53_006025 [Emmonsiellopsis sp. PD_33]